MEKFIINYIFWRKFEATFEEHEFFGFLSSLFSFFGIDLTVSKSEMFVFYANT